MCHACRADVLHYTASAQLVNIRGQPLDTNRFTNCALLQALVPACISNQLNSTCMFPVFPAWLGLVGLQGQSLVAFEISGTL